MKGALTKLVSKRSLIILLAAVLMLSAFNTYLIFESTRSSLGTSAVDYDYVLSQTGGSYKLKNMVTGYVADASASASEAINKAMAEGKSIYLNAGTYILTEDAVVADKVGARIVSDGATIIGDGHRIVVYGSDYTTSQRNQIEGLTLINATIRVENSFATTISNIIFKNAMTGLEFVNTNTWVEYNKVQNCQFINITEGIAFRTPTGNATGSYASSLIERCSFNPPDDSVCINVESLAEFSDSQIQNVRFWLGENGKGNQTALLDNGAMTQTLLLGVVFESFADYPHDLFGIDLGETCDPAPILDSGVSFLGNWTAKVHNPYSKWISGVSGVFERNTDVPVGLNNQYGESQNIRSDQLKIHSFKPQINVAGGFENNETVTVRIRIEYIDNVVSEPVVQSFRSSSSVWLTDNAMSQLFPSQSVIWAILVDAKTSASSTDASVQVSLYGTAG